MDDLLFPNVDSVRSLHLNDSGFVIPTGFSLVQEIGTGPIYIFFWSVFFLDVLINGVGGISNTSWLSFIDSFSHCCYWSIEASDIEAPEQVLGTFLSKFGSGLIFSALLGIYPSFLQIDRLLGFLLALFLAHNNLDLASRVRSRHGKWRILFDCLGAFFNNKSKPSSTYRHISESLRIARSSCIR